ncbi:MAG: DUF2853 family protein [Rhodocyclaceae bacterium]|nr:DUF2853 family protein [Rhodocyclaceae bacterium]MCB1963686.1 DUF2853 family protein [Rhodocyclaceae bacterium]
MTDYVADVKKYASNVDEAVVDKIVKYCGIALRNKDSSLVSSSDKAELDRVRDGFAKKKLELGPEAAEAGIEKVCATLKGVNQKGRVTFYYLLAEATGTMDKLR